MAAAESSSCECAAVGCGVFRALDVVVQGDARVEQSLDDRTFESQNIVGRAAIGAGSADLGLEIIRGRLGDEIDRSTERIAAEISILRSLEDFDPLDVDAADRSLAAGDEDTIDEQRTGILADVTVCGLQAAENDRTLRTAARARTRGLLERESGDVLEPLQVVNPGLSEILGAERLHRDRDVHQRLRTFARRHNDFLQAVARGFAGLLSLGCLWSRERRGADEQRKKHRPRDTISW